MPKQLNISKIQGANTGAQKADTLAQMYPKVNENFDNVKTLVEEHDAEIEQLQGGSATKAALSVEELARIAADSAHANAATAHQATQIQYDGSNNVKQKVDALQTQVNNLTTGAAPNAAEIVDARLGADSVVRASLGAMVREIHTQQLDSAWIQAAVKWGLNNINPGVNAATAKFSASGTTRVNLLGNIGNIIDNNGDGAADGWVKGGSGAYSIVGNAQRITSLSGDVNNTTRNIRKDLPGQAGKYYLYAVNATTDGTSTAAVGTSVGSSTKTRTTTGFLYTKITPVADGTLSFYLNNNNALGSVGWVQFDGARLFEVTAAEYAKIDVDPEWTGDKLAAKFPYVDGVKHSQGIGVKKTGKNLLPGFPDVMSAEATTTAPYNMTLAATANFRTNDIFVDAIPGQSYVFTITKDNPEAYVEASFLDAAGSNIWVSSNWNLALPSGTYSVVQVAPAGTVKARFRMVNRTVGTYKFSNWQLEMNTAATPFEPYNADFIFLPTILASNLDGSIRDQAYERDGIYYKLKKWQTGLSMDGAQAWGNYAGTIPTGSKRTTLSTIVGNVQSIGNNRITKNDGSQLKWADPATDGDSFLFASSVLHASVPHTATGFSDAHTPTTQDWKNFFNGWRMNNGTLGTSYPGTGTKYWTPIVTPKANFVGKVAVSVVDNPNIFKRTSTNEAITTLKTPATAWSETTDSHYGWAGKLDGSTADSTSLGSGYISQHLFSFNLIEHVLRKHGAAVFGAATTVADRVTWLKANIGRITANWYGYGSGPTGNKATVIWWNATGNAWDNSTNTNLTGVVAKVTRTLQGTISNAIDSNGFFHVLAYADASNGTIASTVYTDYIDLDVELNVQTVPASGYSSVEYTPYTLDYVLATAVEEVIGGATGFTSLAAGGNQVELFEGVVTREKIIPAYSTLYKTYEINTSVVPGGVGKSQLANKSAKIIAVYRNGVIDPAWKFVVDSWAYGVQRASCDESRYDATAEYTVTYTVLDKFSYTANIVDAKMEYKSSAQGVQNALVQRMGDAETNISILVRAMAEMYKRVKALGG